MQKVFGSCRVSTKKQNIDRQERNILARFPNAEIFKDYYTGTRVSGRTGLEKILAQVKDGDTIVFDSVSRMSRNADEGIALYYQLYDKGVNLVFLNEPHINTDTYRQALQNGVESVGNDIADIYIEATNKVLKMLARRQIELAFEQSQKEVDDLRERTKQGIETARRNGKQIGQCKGCVLNVKKRAPAKKKIAELCKDFGGVLEDADVMERLKENVLNDEVIADFIDSKSSGTLQNVHKELLVDFIDFLRECVEYHKCDFIMDAIDGYSDEEFAKHSNNAKKPEPYER